MTVAAKIAIATGPELRPSTFSPDAAVLEPVCGQCHGADGKGDPSGPYPRLAGQAALYLYKQLDDYASGSRKNEVMGPIAQALSDQERQDAAAYYAGQNAPYGTASAPPKADLGL